MHNLVKIYWHLLKSSFGNENMGVSRADNSVKNLRNLPISNPKPDLHNINAHTKFSENQLKLTQVIVRKRNTDGRTDILTNGFNTDVAILLPHKSTFSHTIQDFCVFIKYSHLSTHLCVRTAKHTDSQRDTIIPSHQLFLWRGINMICTTLKYC